MTAEVGEFRAAYAAALRRFLELRSDASLEAGHELGRRALEDGVSLLAIVENHFVTIVGLGREDRYAALQFLLQTLTVLDIATRSFLDGNRRYEQERSRADDLAERDSFRRALVDALQDGFFVSDGAGTIVEMNGALAEMTGYGAEELPIAWPYPWLTPERADLAGPYYLSDCSGRSEIKIRHRDGRTVWLAVSANSVRSGTGTDAMYVGTARDVTAEHRAVAAERSAASLATALVAATTVADVLTTGLAECRAALGADAAVAAVWGERGTPPLVYTTGDRPVVAWDDLEPDVAAQLEGVRGESALTVAAVATAGGGNPERPQPVGADAVSGLAATLGDGGDAALWLAYSTPLPGSADRALLRLLLGHLGFALQRARNFDQARTTSLTLQRAMLASVALPVRFAVRYQPAEAPLEVGGDWYDVVPLLEGDRIGIVVGDCVGSGLSAAVVMGQLRSACRALLLSGAGPGQLLDELDAVAARTPGAACTTMCAAILDLDTGELTFSSAGHPPALLGVPHRGVTPLDGGRSLPLATFDCSPRAQATVTLPPGSTLCLFTDGLVERRRASIDDGFDRVAAVVAESAGLAVDDVADRVLAALAPDSGYDDDVAMVVYRSPPPVLRLEVPARAGELTRVRAEFREWCSAAAIPTTRADDLVWVVNELVSNGIEHAYVGREPGNVQVTAKVEADRVMVAVADTGTWIDRPADASGLRGRGLPMARALSDDLDIAVTGTGTTVTLGARATEPNRTC